MATKWLPIVISFLEKYYMMLHFGGGNPGFGVNHVYPCTMCLDVCYSITGLDVYYLFYAPGCSWLIPLSVMM